MFYDNYFFRITASDLNWKIIKVGKRLFPFSVSSLTSMVFEQSHFSRTSKIF